MLIAKKLKEDNIAEYLIYMWQVEDIIRGNNLDLSQIEESLISRYAQPDEVKKEIREWYEGLIEMMRREEIIEKGHLIINRNVIQNLTDLHNDLLKSLQEQEYSAAYYKVLPIIVELRAKSPDRNIPELETVFSAIYGFLLMRLQNKEVSGETQAAISQLSSFLRLLSQKYKEDRENSLNI